MGQRDACPASGWLSTVYHCTSFSAHCTLAAYIEPIGVGDELPDMPLFLTNYIHVKVPLEPTYQATWNALPEELRTAVETGTMPEADAE